MNYTKENAVGKYCETIVNSWTWARLTPDEARRWWDFIEATRHAIKGSAKQRCTQTMHLYQAFLRGCGYDGPYWREPGEDIPLF